MQKAVHFLYLLIEQIRKDDVISIANELTYKLLLALFPFLIFLMSIIGFFNIDGDFLLNQLAFTVPGLVYNVIDTFIREVVSTKSPSILSFSLLVAVFSASSGVYALVRGINKAYGLAETRNFILVRLLSVGLVFVFALAIISSLIVLIFGDSILHWLLPKLQPSFHLPSFRFLGFMAVTGILLFTIMLIYKFATCKKVSFMSVLPGSLITVVCWLAASKIFNIYINNFSRYSVVYGSIGSLFAMMLWLNMICIIMLIGGEINALLKIK